MITSDILRKNIRSIIALIVIGYCVLFDFIVLGIGNSNDLIDRMVTANNSVLMFVLGYYFSANHQVPQNAEPTTSK
mgnify:CR=1 FL=1